jgi:hypothetical protein
MRPDVVVIIAELRRRPARLEDRGKCSPAPAAQPNYATPQQQFGAPPPGRVPMFFNRHQVYARPSIIVKGKLMAAIFDGNPSHVSPLVSMFEQTGATFSYDPLTKAITISKAGAEVIVTVDRSVVVVNGESRPLDQPPIVYEGRILVPVRPIVEAIGARVVWKPRGVVVGYVAATP